MKLDDADTVLEMGFQEAVIWHAGVVLFFGFFVFGLQSESI